MNPIANGMLPWTRSCFVCGEGNPQGLHLRSHVEDGSVVIRYTPGSEHCGWRERVHGGIAMTLLDEVMTWATILSSRRACVAAEFNVRLRKPMIVGHPLRIIGHAALGRSRLVLVEGTILDKDDDVVFASEGKYVPMDSNTATLCVADFVDSPDTIAIADIFDDLPA